MLNAHDRSLLNKALCFVTYAGINAGGLVIYSIIIIIRSLASNYFPLDWVSIQVTYLGLLLPLIVYYGLAHSSRPLFIAAASSIITLISEYFIIYSFETFFALHSSYLVWFFRIVTLAIIIASILYLVLSYKGMDIIDKHSRIGKATKALLTISNIPVVGLILVLLPVLVTEYPYLLSLTPIAAISIMIGSPLFAWHAIRLLSAKK